MLSFIMEGIHVTVTLYFHYLHGCDVQMKIVFLYLNSAYSRKMIHEYELFYRDTKVHMYFYIVLFEKGFCYT